MNKQRISNILSSIQMNPRDRKNLINELAKGGSGGDGITIIDSIDKLDPNAKVGSIASVVTEKSMQLLNIASLPIAELDENYNYIFSDNLVKVNEIKINIIKQTITADSIPAIELFDFNTSYKLICLTNNGFIGFSYYNIDDIKNSTDYLYYDPTTDTINEETLKNISDILTKGNFYFINDCREDDYDKSLIDNLYNTFKLYSISGDTDAELFIKKEIWEPALNSNDGNTLDIVDPSILNSIIKLEVGDEEDVCQRNLKKINKIIDKTENSYVPFIIIIDNMIGSCVFDKESNEEIVGEAALLAHDGYIMKCNIYKNGKVGYCEEVVDVFDLDTRLKALEGTE